MYYCRAEGANKTSVAASGAPLNQMQVDIDFNVRVARVKNDIYGKHNIPPIHLSLGCRG